MPTLLPKHAAAAFVVAALRPWTGTRCDVAFVSAAAAALTSRLAGSAGGGWNGEQEKSVSLAEYDILRPRWKRAPPPVEEEVLVLVMASRSLEYRAALLAEAWSSRRIQHLFLVDEWLESVPRDRQWLRLAAGEGAEASSSSRSGAVDQTYWDAQSRQLAYMKASPRLAERHPGVKWVLLADDDTWVHEDRLLSFLAGRDADEEPVLFTYVLSDAHVLGYDYPCGGAGMLLSRSAYDLLAPRVLTSACPLLSFNDLTLGFCAHAQGIPMVHHPDMHCSPDVNRAMRPGENVLDLQRALSVHRLPEFSNYPDLLEGLRQMEGQLDALLGIHCRLAARALASDRGAVLDSRRFFWSAEAFPDVVRSCRGFAPEAASPQNGEPLHLDFVLFGGGVPVARYHKDRRPPLVAEPAARADRWPEWMEQLRSTGGAAGGAGGGGAEGAGAPPKLSWSARWVAAPPRIGRRQLEASLPGLAESAGAEEAAVRASFGLLEAKSPHGSWLEELRRAARALLRDKGGRRRLGGIGLGRTWLFAGLVAKATFVNVDESARSLRTLSDLFRPGRGHARFADDGVRTALSLGSDEPPPLALGYELFDLHVEQDAGLWLNGPALERLLKCPPLGHPIALDAEVHANDWETEQERLSLLWHNALAVDIFRTLRFCGVLLLHEPRMVPHALKYLPYSTYRRPHVPSVAAALTIGNIEAREQMFAMTQIVRRLARQLRRRIARRRPGTSPPSASSTTSSSLPAAAAAAEHCAPGPSLSSSAYSSALSSAASSTAEAALSPTAPWRAPLRMRVLGEEGSALELSDRNWQLPGARLFGMTLVAFRSEHFLPDAQAA